MDYLNLCLVSLLAAAIGAPLIMRVLHVAQSRQKISEHVQEHAHKQGTPTMGGLIILLGLIPAFFYLPAGEPITPAVLIGGFALIGLLDDFIVPKVLTHTRGLGWKEKFVLQIVVSIVAYWFGGVRDVGAFAFLTFFILFFANAYNFADGLDSLAGGIAVMVSVGLTVVGFYALEPDAFGPVAIMTAALVGGTIPFLYLNAPPAKVFMGDVGALPIGALLGWTFLEVGRPSELMVGNANLIASIIISFILIVELVPVPLQIASVKLRKGKRLFPKTPIHHAFQHAGWPETRVVWMFHLTQAVLILIGFAVLARGLV